MKKMLTVCIIVIVTIVLGWLWFDNKTIKPEDEISCAIAKEIGNDVEYLGTRDYKEDELCYKYLVQKHEKDVLYNITAIVNETIQREKISNKVDIYFCYEIPGAIGNAARLCNYSQNELLVPDCGGLQRLVIAGNDFSEGDIFFDDINTYLVIPDIRYLEISEEIQKVAEAEDIDWYEYWPELKSIKVFE